MMESDEGGGLGAGGGSSSRTPPKHRVLASSASVVQQARLMQTAGTAWHAVKCGNLEMITKLFPHQVNVYAKGPVGENVMHVAMLLNTPSTLAITRYLVKLFGASLVNCPIQERRSPQDPPGTYEGQTALHIAIVNRDVDMVKFLVQARANVRARAWGTFFRADGPMYYGEFPLSFAVCTGQKDIMAYLIRHGAQVNSDRDALGNTALHMAVIHEQPDMYDFLVDFCGADVGATNNSGLTPLVLAAHLGRVAIFRHITSRRRRTFYSFGRVTSYSLPLHEIDTVQDAVSARNGGYVPNTLEVVVRKRHSDMLQEPLLSTLLQHKWECFARAQFLLHFAGYLLLEVSQTILIWLISDPVEWNRAARASQEFVGVILALTLLVVEVVDFVNWSREAYHRRLTMRAASEAEPPLYPIPGEMRDAPDRRESLFARLSARIGFHTNSASVQGGGAFNSHPSNASRKSADPAAAGGGSGSAAAGGGGGEQQQLEHQRPSLQQQQQSSRLGKPPSPRKGGQGRGDSYGPRSLGGTAEDGARPLLSPQQLPQQERPPLLQVPEGQPPLSRQPTGGTPPASGRVSPFSTYGAPAGALSPRSAAAVSLARASSGPTDTPINLDPMYTGGVVVGGGKSPAGVGVVDSGLLAPGQQPAAGARVSSGDGGAAAVPAVTIRTSSGRLPGPAARPLAEGREQPPAQQQAVAEGREGAASPPAPGSQQQPAPEQAQQVQPAQQQQQQGCDADDDVDVVSVGLPVNRVRSFASLAQATGSPAGGSGSLAASLAPADQATLEGLLGSPGPHHPGQSLLLGRALAADAGGGSAPASHRPSFEGASWSVRPSFDGSGGGGSGQQQPQHQQRVTFSSTVTNVVGDPRSASSISFTQQPQQQQVQQQTAPVGIIHTPSTHASFTGDAAVGSGSSNSNSLLAQQLLQSPSPSPPVLYRSSPSFGTGQLPASELLLPECSGDHALAAAAYSPPLPLRPLVQKARSFTSVSPGPDGSMHGAAALAASGRAATMDAGLMSLATLSTPADPAEAMSMAERQRTRARSGGGDLVPGLALKRSTFAKKDIGSSTGLDSSVGSGALSPVKSGRVPSAAAPSGTSAAAVGGSHHGGGSAFATPGLTVWPSSKWASDDGGGGVSGGGGADVERAVSASVLDPHKTRLRALLETTYEGAVRMVEDPWLFVWHLHLLLTLLHFLTWISSYGWIGGSGPRSITVRQFDDVIVSMMGLSGWLAVIYFFRGFQPTGKLAYILERAIVDVLKYVSLFVLWDLGFTLAFYTMQNGVLAVAPDQQVKRDTPGITAIDASEVDPFNSIGSTMMTLINLGAGLSHYEYSMTCRNGYVLSSALCTIYYLLYLATVVLLLMNLLTAMIITTWHANQATAVSHWKHRWALYVLKAERRLPPSWAQRLRLGQPAWDAHAQCTVYSHVFETVDEDRPLDAGGKAGLDGQIRAMEATLDELRRKRGGGGS